MPGYGIAGPSEGTGLLPWAWAEERLSGSRNYWAVTLWPDGRPHAMPVWGVWDDASFWFSKSLNEASLGEVKGWCLAAQRFSSGGRGGKPSCESIALINVDEVVSE